MRPPFSPPIANLPCTVGVDISPDFLRLSEFGPLDGEPPRERIVVGFLDAEGQGDQGIEYDVHLVAPLLLVSKVRATLSRATRLGDAARFPTGAMFGVHTGLHGVVPDRLCAARGQ
jgi:hypothetical protein